ncbi:MAG: hypothetical protein OEM94_06295 [Acidimicrobiia bacterium]|nr:hypothetical protein [Acidimicrobiia bacterium]
MGSKKEEPRQESEAAAEAGHAAEPLDVGDSRVSDMAKKLGEATSEGYKKARPVVVSGAKKGAHLAAVGGRKGAHLAVVGAGKAKDLVVDFWQKRAESEGPANPEDHDK